ncbi:MAG: Wzz/FepE/Etk N-terminal domain-containing protein, partial [Mariprofundaceae bacterium]|nr:Wzz/FepE/Etk N-terminal domain-containing protein [Mariprofundaceae bacterium]
MMQKNQQQMEYAEVNQEDEIDLSEYLDALLDGKWVIVLIALCFFLCAAVYAKLSTPIYQADALIQVESQSPTLGAGSNNLMALMGQGDTSSSTE